MVRALSLLIGFTVALSGCDVDGNAANQGKDLPEPGITFTGTAVFGITGGSGKPTRVISGLK
ncbi:hypothetical protein [Psychromarinibacter sp. S121]|uniref:hypothetical protein n=1 Tax=Psychromarinibacter sp. S121 TaxID=3415127 RepID=UPI003C7A8113